MPINLEFSNIRVQCNLYFLLTLHISLLKYKPGHWCWRIQCTNEDVNEERERKKMKKLLFFRNSLWGVAWNILIWCFPRFAFPFSFVSYFLKKAKQYIFFDTSTVSCIINKTQGYSLLNHIRFVSSFVSCLF